MITNFQKSWRALQRTWCYPKPFENKLPTGTPQLSPILECIFLRNKGTLKNIHSTTHLNQKLTVIHCDHLTLSYHWNFAGCPTISFVGERCSSVPLGAIPGLPRSAAVISLSWIFLTVTLLKIMDQLFCRVSSIVADDFLFPITLIFALIFIPFSAYFTFNLLFSSSFPRWKLILLIKNFSSILI